MSIFDQAIDQIKQSAQQIVGSVAADLTNDLTADYKALWTVNGTDWYKVFRYMFEIYDINDPGPAKFSYAFPIPPQMFAPQQIPASQVTATFGGLVEETNRTLFWSIGLSGSFGTAVSRGPTISTPNGTIGNTDGLTRSRMAHKFRDTISSTGLLAGISASLGQAATKLGGVIDGIKNASDPAGFVGSFNNAILPPSTFAQSAVDGLSNGYTEAQDLSKFLYFYSILKEKSPKRWALRFRNDKDNQRWRVIVKSFGLQKTSGSPFSYKYQIALQGWNVEDAAGGKNRGSGQDRFGKGGDLQSINIVGLDALKDMKAIYNNVTGSGKQNSGLLLKPGSSLL